MRLRNTALALLCSAAVAACHAASTYTPQTGDSSPASSILATPKGCTAKPVSVPGKYIGMYASGTVSGTTFTSLFGQWSLLAYRKPAASDSSGAKPASTSSPSPSYFYTGTYTMKKTKKQGCVLLVIGQAAKSNASDPSSNGVVTAAPTIKMKNYRVTVSQLGLLSMKLTGLSASGGSGTATLITQDFKPYDTATIVLGKRTKT